MKIIVTVHQFLPDHSSGTEVIALGIAKELQGRGHEVVVVTGYPDPRPLRDEERFDRYTYDGLRVERFRHSPDPMGDQHVKATLGIDVFAESFDQARGWQIYEGKDARLLLIRQESFARLPEALSAFFGLQLRPAAIQHANAGEGHAYRGTYREAKERIRVPASLLDTVYSARYASHFYSPDEISGFKERWGEPVP